MDDLSFGAGKMTRADFLRGLGIGALTLGSGRRLFGAEDGPRVKAPFEEWTDKETGRRVRRIAPPSLPHAYVAYHHVRAFTADGRWMCFTGKSDLGMDIYAFDLRTETISRLTHTGQGGLAGVVARRNEALVLSADAYHLLSVPDGKLRRLTDRPAGDGGNTDTTADGRYVVAGYMETTEEARKLRGQPGWVAKLARLNLKYTFFTIDLETGERKDFYWNRTFPDHLQCSPTDPTLFNYIRYSAAERDGGGIWLMRSDGVITESQCAVEGGHHHIWSPDGKYVYYDFGDGPPWAYWRWHCLTRKTEQVLPPEEWNFHFCVSPDGQSLVGDGNWSDGYINLYHLQGGGKYRKERLCKRVTSKLRTEDQARFAPDGKSVFFNGIVDGARAIFQVLL